MKSSNFNHNSIIRSRSDGRGFLEILKSTPQENDNQFSLASLLTWIVGFSFVCVLAFTGSTISTMLAAIGLSAMLAISYFRRERKLVTAGGLAGFVFSCCLWFSLAANVVRKGPIIHGQLYHEDGPESFFFLVFLLGSISGVFGAILGACLAAVVKFLYFVFVVRLPTKD